MFQACSPKLGKQQQEMSIARLFRAVGGSVQEAPREPVEARFLERLAIFTRSSMLQACSPKSGKQRREMSVAHVCSGPWGSVQEAPRGSR